LIEPLAKINQASVFGVCFSKKLKKLPIAALTLLLSPVFTPFHNLQPETFTVRALKGAEDMDPVCVRNVTT
jgi:hypothetical protein